MMNLVVTSNIGIIYDNAKNYMVIGYNNDYIFLYISQCDLVLKHKIKQASAIDEFKNTCMELLINDQMMPIYAIRTMEDGKIDEMVDAIEVANTILSKIFAQ